MEHFKASQSQEDGRAQLFRLTTKWEDWYPSFINLLRHQPGHDGVPLAYIIRDKVLEWLQV